MRKTIVVLHGLSGSGKTSLVDTLREPVASSHGYFVAGKFFQPTMDVTQEPHSAIMAAFSDLCDLVLQSSDFDNQMAQYDSRSARGGCQLVSPSDFQSVAIP
jgi:predicted ATPase